MKIETLNIWGGKVYQPLMDHVANSARDRGVFCFQEVFDTSTEIKESNGARVNILAEIRQALPGFKGIYCPAEQGLDYNGAVDFDLSFGIASFVRKNLDLLNDGCTTVYRGDHETDPQFGQMPRNLQHFQIRDSRGVETFISNLHGVWIPGYKGDSPARIEQSRQVRRVLDAVSGRKIVCGDFNLDFKTESFKILSGDMQNLIEKFGIETTRSRLYGKPNKFADYILTSPEIQVTSCQTLDLEVSDHLPVVVECD